MKRSSPIVVMAVVLVVYGLYVASHVPAMLVGPPSSLLIAFVLQAVCAFAAAVGVWSGARWAAAALVLLGLAIAGTWLLEAFVLGIVAYLYALLAAATAFVITLILAAYVNRLRSAAGA
jgi:hypothetical protein